MYFSLYDVHVSLVCLDVYSIIMFQNLNAFKGLIKVSTSIVYV